MELLLYSELEMIDDHSSEAKEGQMGGENGLNTSRKLNCMTLKKCVMVTLEAIAICIYSYNTMSA